MGVTATLIDYPNLHKTRSTGAVDSGRSRRSITDFILASLHNPNVIPNTPARFD